MDIQQLAAEIGKLGREISPSTLGGARALYTPFHSVAPFDGVTLHRDIRYAAHERNRLDLFTPVEPTVAPRPVIVFVHGGGFTGGDKYTPDTPFFDNIGLWAVRNGLVGINITYRLAPEHVWPAAVEDIADVVAWIKTNCRGYGIDENRIYLIGQSAGASLVATYLSHPQISVPQPHGIAGAVLMSGMYDLVTLTHNRNSIAFYGDDASLYAERSSIHGLCSTDVPLLITIAEHEPAMFERQTLDLIDRIQAQRRKLPRFLHLIGHNHLSGILHLGLPGDALGPQLLNLIRESRR